MENIKHLGRNNNSVLFLPNFLFFANPMLSEGDIFEIRIPIKKSDINFQKSDIETKKSDISLQKSDIENEKLSEEYLMQKCKQYSYNIIL